MKTFGFPSGALYPTGGVYGLGATTGVPLRQAVVTTKFNVVDEYHSTPHSGVDLSSVEAEDADIRAPLDGIVAQNYAQTWPGPGPLVLFPGTASEKVIQPGEPDRGGNVLILIHDGPWRLPDGSTAIRAATLYCHLRELPPLPVGTQVKAGDVIGRQGTTGFSTGPHLHWSLAFQRDPMGWFPPNFSDAGNNDDPLQYLGLTVTEVPGPLVEGEITDGLSLVLITGTPEQLDELDVVSVTTTNAGKYVVYIPGAPPMVNSDFIHLYPAGLNRTPSIVKRGD